MKYPITIIIGVLLYFLLLTPTVYGNGLWIKKEFTTIEHIYEIDDVKGNELYVDVAFHLHILPSLSNISNNTVIEFEPDVSYGEPVVKNISICESGGYSSGLTYGSFSIECNKETMRFLKIEQIGNFKQVYLITIPVENLTTIKSYIVRIMYKIPNFVRKEGTNNFLSIGTNNILSFQSRCQPNGAPCNIDNWDRIIRLPSPTSVIVDSSENVNIKGIGDKGDERWILSAKGGGPFFIRYYDSKERDLNVPFYWAVIGGAIGAVLGVLLDKVIIGVFFRKKMTQKLLQSSGHLYADEMPVENTNLTDLNIDMFKSFYERRTHEKLEDLNIPLEKLMSNLKLMADDKLTLAGLLVFGKKPEEKKPQFVIKAVLFPGNSPAVSEYKDSRDISGNIPKIFEASRSFLINNLRWVQKDQHFNTTGILEIPQIALEEALINAIVHRNYFISSNIRIFIFDDRVEIISPGALPNTINVDSIKMGIHIERNPILVSLLKDVENIPYRGIGTGVQRILHECRDAGITVDFLEEKENEQFKVIFYRKN